MCRLYNRLVSTGDDKGLVYKVRRVGGAGHAGDTHMAQKIREMKEEMGLKNWEAF